jgi:hypothetical protein
MYEACFFHDLKYWAGGDDIDRLIADFELGIDVAKLGLPDMAQTMYEGVRGFGWLAWRKI